MADARLTDWPFVILRGSQNSTPGTRISSSRSLSQYDNKTFTFYVDFSTNFNRSGSHRCNTTPRERPCWSAARRKWKKKKTNTPTPRLRVVVGTVRTCVRAIGRAEPSERSGVFRIPSWTARGEDGEGWGRRGVRTSRDEEGGKRYRFDPRSTDPFAAEFLSNYNNILSTRYVQSRSVIIINFLISFLRVIIMARQSR